VLVAQDQVTEQVVMDQIQFLVRSHLLVEEAVPTLQREQVVLAEVVVETLQALEDQVTLHLLVHLKVIVVVTGILMDHQVVYQTLLVVVEVAQEVVQAELQVLVDQVVQEQQHI